MALTSKALQECLDNANLSALLGRILGERDSGLAAWPSHKRALLSPRFVLPVLGIQGAGKSSLLNALCFDRPVLPVDADETTAVPVEIVYADTPSLNAQIHFKDGRNEVVPADPKHLNPFVDQESNPGNKIGVLRVVVETNTDLLQDGVVLVDLPGFGSMNLANQETALGYLEEASSVLFLLRDIPPLTRTEAGRLLPVWSRSPMIFAMNRWDSRREEEILESRTAAADLLKEKATQFNIPLDGDQVDVHVVNVWKALDASLRRDALALQVSGIETLRQELAATIGNWSPWLIGRIRNRLLGDLNRAQAALTSRIGDLDQDPETAAKNIQAEREVYQTSMNAIQVKFNEVKRELQAWRQTQLGHLSHWETEEGARIRNKVRTLGSKGLTDGTMLDRALEDEFDQSFETALGALGDENQKIERTLETILTEIQALRFAATIRSGVYRPSAFKFERYAQSACATVAAAGCALAEVTFGLSLIVSAGALLTGFLIKSTAGSMRRKAMEQEVFPHVREVLRDNRQGMERSVSDFEKEMVDGLASWKQRESEQAEWEFNDRLQTVQSEKDRKDQLLRQLREDSRKVTDWVSMLTEVGQ